METLREDVVVTRRGFVAGNLSLRQIERSQVVDPAPHAFALNATRTGSVSFGFVEENQ
jgi:hypothetical protein